MKTTNRDKYRTLCLREAIPFFSQAWWLDAVTGGDGWDVVLIERGGSIVASLPYVRKRRKGMVSLTQPPLTQTLGPWIKADGELNHTKMLARQKSLMDELIESFPLFHAYNQNWHYSQRNWLPFYWRGFHQTTRYTYLIPDLSDLGRVWGGIQSNIRREIGKATNRFSLSVRSDLGISDFFELNKKVFARQGLGIPYDIKLLSEIHHVCTQRNSAKIFIAEDAMGRMHAGVYLVWDSESAYYLMGGGDPNLRNSGATSLCMWEAIKFASTVTKKFDFEGSMLEPVERFFRAFGAEQMQYFNVYKSCSKLNRCLLLLRQFYQAKD